MVSHLLELRKRLKQALWVLLGFFFVFYWKSEAVLQTLCYPLLNNLTQGQELIATNPLSAAITPLSVAFYSALLVCTPYALLQLWLFISPGLYRHERGFSRLILILSAAFFLIGILFAYYCILPLLFAFLASTLPAQVRLMPELAISINLILKMLLLFGVLFQLPLVLMIGVKLGWLSLEKLRQFRPYVIVFNFVLGMLLTPPDVISQILVALPLCGLYELGIILGRLIGSKATVPE